MAYSIELFQRICNDEEGSYIEIGPHEDGLDLITIKTVASNGEVSGQISLTDEELKHLHTLIGLRLQREEE